MCLMMFIPGLWMYTRDTTDHFFLFWVYIIYVWCFGR